jgi:acyl-CoA thioester hydrolase
MDTDAAGIWHHSTAVRWTEDAEASLHRRLGIISETFGATPRAHVGYDFLSPLQFDDEVEVHLAVVKVGQSSVEYQITVEHQGELAVTGRMVTVLIDAATQRKQVWPDQLREALTDDRAFVEIPPPCSD